MQPAFTDRASLESEHYLLRPMVPADAFLAWGDWTADPETALALNATPRTLDVAARQKYIASFDRKVGHLIGIWQKKGGSLVGFWAVYVDEASKEFLLNVLVGEDRAREQGALKETRDLLYEYLFNERGMKAARCTVVAQNEKMIAFLRRHHWRQIASSQRAAPTAGGSVDVLAFRLSREDWRKRFEEH